MLSVLISGLVTGLLYGLAGLGLVAVYRASKVMNFALGGMGAFVAYLAKDLLGAGIPYWLVLPFCVVAAAVLGGLLELLIARPMSRQSHLSIGLATLGALLLLEGAIDWRWTTNTAVLPQFIDPATVLRIGGLTIAWNSIFIVLVAIAASVLLVLVVDRTSFGLKMRAISAGPQTSALLGVNVRRVRMSSWMLGGAYGCLAALLVIPLTYLSPSSFTTFLLTAFAAVVLGGLTNIIGVVIGAVLFGIAFNLMSVYVDGSLLSTYTFIGVTLVLVFRPNGLFGRSEKEISEPRLSRPQRPGRSAGAAASRNRVAAASAALTGPGSLAARIPAVKYTGWATLMLVLVAVPFILDELNMNTAGTILATFIGVLGLNVIAGFSGQASLANGAFLAIGAFTTAYLVNHGVDLFLALISAAAIGAIIGFLLGLPATRLSGIYLLLYTLMFAFAVPELIALMPAITGGADGSRLNPPGFGVVDAIPQFYLALGGAALAAVVVMIAAATKLGRTWRAVRDSPAGAQALGYRAARVRLGSFAFGSALVAFGGGVSGVLIGQISPENYGVFVAIYALLAVVLGGSGSVFGSLLGAAFIVIVPSASARSGVIPGELVMGLALVLVLIFAPGGLAPLLFRLWAWLVGIITRRAGTGILDAPVLAGSLRADETVGPDEAIAEPARSKRTAVASSVVGHVTEATPRDMYDKDVPPALLALEDIRAGYEAGLVLSDFSLEVRAGEVVTLLGANGAGKSTVLRAVSGLVPVLDGRILWQGQQIGSGKLSRVERIAHTGLGHVPEGRATFPDLTVRENLRMGYFARGGGSSQPDDEWERVLEMFPILRERFAQRAGSLSGGQQQMLAIARALIGKPKLLMLDEPSLGLAPVVSEQVFDKLREIAAGGVSVLLVEQNAFAALELADRGYVIQRGRVAISGTAEELRADPRLSKSYLAVH
ncbi:ATP-binding cassette domain-containing protein [Arthrobacter sp. NPDC058097]|uniref:ABC transporter permease subunit n=1 Tax=Arthrobacter sp. NPDC058097 TaxID=3346340 RepID=UPI0036D90115